MTNHYERLEAAALRLAELYESARADIQDRFTCLPEEVRDTDGRFVLLDALTALVNANTALVNARGRDG